jgi:hypothetical protein
VPRSRRDCVGVSVVSPLPYRLQECAMLPLGTQCLLGSELYLDESLSLHRPPTDRLHIPYAAMCPQVDDDRGRDLHHSLLDHWDDAADP